MTEDKMVGWHHQLNGQEFEQDLADGEGQGSLACCSPWGSKELDMTQHNFVAAVTMCRDFGTQENKICHCFHFFLFYLP